MPNVYLRKMDEAIYYSRHILTIDMKKSGLWKNCQLR